MRHPFVEALHGRRRFWIRSVLLALVVVYGSTGTVRAATFQVTTTLDASDVAPGDGICQTLEGSCSLRAAVEEANLLADEPDVTDEILLPAGVYALTMTTVADDGIATGLQVFGRLMIVGAGRDLTILDGALVDRVFRGCCQLELRRLAIENTRGSVIRWLGTVRLVEGLLFRNGGGIGIQLGLISIVDSDILENGGSIGGNGDVTVESSRIADNAGTGVYVSESRATVTNSVIERNGGSGVFGSLGFLNVADSVVRGNGEGGVITSGPGEITIHRSLVEDNVGNGVRIEYDSRLVVADSRITRNVGVDGGGIHGGAGFPRDIRIENSTIDRNHALHNGGGISFGGQGSLTIINSTISHNRAGERGGGVSNESYLDASVRLESVTLSDNIADGGPELGEAGGGIFRIVCPDCPRPLQLVNSIVANNLDLSGAAPDCAGGVSLTGTNLVEHTAGCALSGDLAASVLDVDPRLAPLDDNGGFAPTRRLLPGSPAIDAGGHACGSVDQRGTARPQYRACDLGAYELDRPPLVPPDDRLPSLCPRTRTRDARTCEVGDIDRAMLGVTRRSKRGAAAIARLSWTRTSRATDFGDPTTRTGYVVCLYDDSGETGVLTLTGMATAGSDPTGTPSWKRTPGGFTYSAAPRRAEVIRALRLRNDRKARSRVSLRAVSSAVPPVLGPNLTVELHSSDGSCWRTALRARTPKRWQNAAPRSGTP